MKINTQKCKPPAALSLGRSKSQEQAQPSAPPIYFNREAKTNDRGLIGSRSLGTRAGAPPLSPSPSLVHVCNNPTFLQQPDLLGRGCRNRGANSRRSRGLQSTRGRSPARGSWRLKLARQGGGGPGSTGPSSPALTVTERF